MKDWKGNGIIDGATSNGGELFFRPQVDNKERSSGLQFNEN